MLFDMSSEICHDKNMDQYETNSTIIIIIITLFQEYNIFGTNASLTYVLKYKDMHAFHNYKTIKIIYSMYRAGEVSVHWTCCERATKPYSLGEGGTIYPSSRPAGVTTRSPRMVTECLVTRSMLIKIHLKLQCWYCKRKFNVFNYDTGINTCFVFNYDTGINTCFVFNYDTGINTCFVFNYDTGINTCSK